MVTEQEQGIRALGTEIGKVKKVIKSLEARLTKTQAHLEQIQSDISNKPTTAFEGFRQKKEVCFMH